MPEPEFIFICGCARSGTTAITHLLNSHPEIALGMERYKFFLRDKISDKITPELFKEENFFNIKDNETNISPKKDNEKLAWTTLYNSLKEKYKLRKITKGDKCPNYFYHYTSLDKNFKNKKFVFILRDISDVACSFNARAENPNDKNWPPERDYKVAVKEWNDSIILSLKQAEINPENFILVEYERLFSYNQEYLKYILGRLGFFDIPECVLKFYEQQTKDWEERKNKKKIIKKGQAEYIEENAKFGLKAELLSKYGSASSSFPQT